MPGGDTPPVHGRWQPVPGAEGAAIWPYLRKVDNVSSNTYLVRSGDLTVVIDPGGLASQADEICAVLEGDLTPCILALLTHAHADHLQPLMDHPFFADRTRVPLAVHEAGALALARADPLVTQADLLERDIAPVRTTLALFAAPDLGRGGEVRQSCGNTDITLTTKFRTRKDGRIVPEQVLRAGSSCEFTLYHTPGHSPDSICIQAGSLLFIGDLLFAAAPGVAGMHGWDRNALVASIDTVRALLAGGGITYCLPGHGAPLSREDALRVFAGVRRDAAALEGIEELTLARAKETALYAAGLMDEVERIFTFIAARLLFVSHVLEELEESGEAGSVAQMIDAGRLDDLMDDFHRFSAEFRAGARGNVQLALKAGQIVGKLDRLFAQQELALVLDPEYVHRAGRLLCDYTTVLRGYRQPRMLRKIAPASIASDIVSSLGRSGARDGDLLDAADDPAAFTRALVRKLAHSSAFDRVTCSCTDDAASLFAEADSAILGDVIRSVLEDFAGAGCGEIAVRVSANAIGAGEGATAGAFAGAGVAITIMITSPAAVPAPSALRLQFLADECSRAGGTLAWDSGPAPACVRIDLPPAPL